MKIPRQQIEQKTRFPGQWLLFNCSVNTSDHVTLWFRKNRKSDEKLQVIDRKIILVSKNIFNITRLTDKDRGFYICRVCGQEKQIFAEILKGKLVLKVYNSYLLQKILNSRYVHALSTCHCFS
jgi:hypothetical protein